MKKKNTKKWKSHGSRKFGSSSSKFSPNSNNKMKGKLRKMFRMNYDGK
jgi:hypothetical protein